MATAYERVRIARGAKRPTGMDYLQNVFHGFFELHGDRRYADDPAIVGGLAYLGATPVTAVSYKHLRAHETPEHPVCRLLLVKKKYPKMLCMIY